MKKLRYSLTLIYFTVLLLFLISCGGGGSNSNQSTINSNTDTYSNYQKTTFSLNTKQLLSTTNDNNYMLNQLTNLELDIIPANNKFKSFHFERSISDIDSNNSSFNVELFAGLKYRFVLKVYHQSGKIYCAAEESYTIFLDDNNIDLYCRLTPEFVNEAPQVDFSYENASDSLLDLVANEPIKFINNSSDDFGIKKCTWYFGDGEAIESCGDIEHTFGNEGTFSVTLTIEDVRGGVRSISKQITILDNHAPVAQYSYQQGYRNDISVDPSTSYDIDGTIVKCEWYWGDGSSEIDTDCTAKSHTFDASGDYDLTLRVYDDKGASSQLTKRITVAITNMPPVSDFILNKSGMTGYLNPSLSYDPDGNIDSCEIDWGDGRTNVYNECSSIITHTYNQYGDFTIILKVFDENGGFDESSQNIQIIYVNKRPNAIFTFVTGDYNDLTVNSSSYDPDGNIVECVWNWGDGSSTTDTSCSAVTHTYLEEGEYQVKLTVTDNEGEQDSSTKTVVVSIANQPPTADYTYTVGSNKNLTVNSTSIDSDGQITKCKWDWGDGNSTTDTTCSTVTHTYIISDTYDVTLTVTDDDNATDNITKSININLPPTAGFTYTVGNNNDISVSSNSIDDDGQIIKCEWDWGDGSSYSDPTCSDLTHTYSDIGEYTVTLTVTDDDNATDSVNHLVQTHTPPLAEFTYTTGNYKNITVYPHNESYDGTSIIECVWDWGDGTSPTVDPNCYNKTHYYSKTGDYDITLTVTDDMGSTGTVTHNVHVIYNPPPPPPNGPTTGY